MSTPSPATPASGPGGTGPTRVLLVDDTALFRGAIAMVLATDPAFEVVGQAGTGLEGVEQALALRPDLVLMDLEMPVMDGLDAARRIVAELPGTRVVMLTVVDDDARLVEAVRLGVHGYLLKDLDPLDLIARLHDAVADRSPVAPQLVGRLMAHVRTGSPGAAPASDEPRIEDLSARELEIMRLVAQGLSNRQIGRSLCITEGTVKNHVHNALHKLGMESRVQAAAYIVRRGYAAPPS